MFIILHDCQDRLCFITFHLEAIVRHGYFQVGDIKHLVCANFITHQDTWEGHFCVIKYTQPFGFKNDTALPHYFPLQCTPEKVHTQHNRS